LFISKKKERKKKVDDKEILIKKEKGEKTLSTKEK
jgi:hypothetical protein